VKQVRLQLVQAVESPAQLQLVQAVVLLVRTQLVLQVPVLPAQKPLRRTLQSIQDVHQLEQLYLLQHRLQEEFPQLVKEFLYQPCQ
jgi:hypothetical protein